MTTTALIVAIIICITAFSWLALEWVVEARREEKRHKQVQRRLREMERGRE